MDPLVGLNPEQKRAVECVSGAQLIFAGAGSGKTKVLTHKIAYLIDKGYSQPRHILAVTFTNKAAKELKERIERILKGNVGGIQVGTFHSICARMLRREIERLNYTPHLSIYDQSDQLVLLKKILDDNDIILNGVKPRSLLRRISYLKNWMIGPEEFKPRRRSNIDQLIRQVYPLYQKALKRSNAVDFDDLLILPLTIFETYPDVLKKYQKTYRYILVDEYQDTNQPQFLLANALAREHRNICVVGDDDQSIYSWRGANVENILKFNQYFPECKTFKLEQNYRSSNNILKAAAAVVANNNSRAQKELWSDRGDGELLMRIRADDDYDEAGRMAAFILREIPKKKRNFKDFVVLYRTNAQTRVIEEIFRRNNIPYVIVGGVRFYERKEIKDILAYFQVLSNSVDDVSLTRIINFPPRGIGEATFKVLKTFALQRNLSLFEALSHYELLDLSKRSKNALRDFYRLITESGQLRTKLSLEEWTRIVIDKTGLRSYYKESDSEEVARQRLANIDELLNDISEFCMAEQQPTLETYLEKVALITSIDVWEDQKNAVSLMTLHSAKGLEFPMVLICGLNDGLLPLRRDDSDESIEEERRLFYVGMTRAQNRVVLLSASTRHQAGVLLNQSESPFLSEIPDELIEVDHAVGAVVRPKSARSYRRRSAASSAGSWSADVTQEARPGAIVSHKIFGSGRVLNVSGEGPKARLKIAFNNYGIKTIVAKYVRIGS